MVLFFPNPGFAFSIVAGKDVLVSLVDKWRVPPVHLIQPPIGICVRTVLIPIVWVNHSDPM